jgi:hypothetical protein
MNRLAHLSRPVVGAARKQAPSALKHNFTVLTRKALPLYRMAGYGGVAAVGVAWMLWPAFLPDQSLFDVAPFPTFDSYKWGYMKNKKDEDAKKSAAAN